MRLPANSRGTRQWGFWTSYEYMEGKPMSADSVSRDECNDVVNIGQFGQTLTLDEMKQLLQKPVEEREQAIRERLPDLADLPLPGIATR
jgi:hypothetical protein